MGKLRIAIVGCGGIANQKHMPSIKTQADKAEMVAFCDIIPERAEKAAKEYGVEGAKVYTDYKEMLADTSIEIDVVHVHQTWLTAQSLLQHLRLENMLCARNQWLTIQKMPAR